MEEKELAEFRNRVLEEVAKHTSIHTMHLYDDLENPLNDYEQFLHLVVEMTNNFSKYIRREEGADHNFVINSFHVERTLHTKPFLKAGGFVNQYESDLEADIEAEKLAARDRRIKDLEARKLKTFWIPIAVSILSLGLAAYSLWKPSDNVTKEELGKEVETIQDSIQRLKIDFENETKELKVRLQEAEMLIAVYESDSLP